MKNLGKCGLVFMVLLAAVALGVAIPMLEDLPVGVEAANMPPALRDVLPPAVYVSATPQSIVRTGLAPTYGAADAGGNQFVNTGRQFIHIKNTNAGTRSITITTPATVDGLTVEDLYVTIPATTGDKMIGPFPTKYFNYTGALTKVDYSQVADVTFAVIKLP